MKYIIPVIVVSMRLNSHENYNTPQVTPQVHSTRHYGQYATEFARKLYHVCDPESQQRPESP